MRSSLTLAALTSLVVLVGCDDAAAQVGVDGTSGARSAQVVDRVGNGTVGTGAVLERVRTAPTASLLRLPVRPVGGNGGGDDTTGSNNPLAGATFYVNPDNNAARQADSWASSDPDGAALMQKIATNAVAQWLGEWSGDVEGTVRSAVDTATAAGSVPAFVAYNIPNRDCGNHSAGGAADAAAYMDWVDGIARGLGGQKAVVVLEPDAVALVDCLDATQRAERNEMLSYAAQTLKENGAVVYIDAGHSAWMDAASLATRLQDAGIANADGFALNVSNFRATDESVAYGDQVGELLGGKHYVVDTSRNGLGPNAEEWCNPAGRALGNPPGTNTDSDLADAYLWIKAPGESDGDCGGGPSAGQWWPEYARGLAERASW